MAAKTARRLSELAPRIMGAFHDLGSHHPEGIPLTMRQYQALIILHANKKLILSEFCEKLNLAASTGTELANRMISLEYITKSNETPDRRKTYLTVSDKGVAVLQKRQKVVTEMFTNFLEPFCEKDRVKFIDCFEQIYPFLFT